jgi:hypothetical protein
VPTPAIFFIFFFNLGSGWLIWTVEQLAATVRYRSYINLQQSTIESCRYYEYDHSKHNLANTNANSIDMWQTTIFFFFFFFFEKKEKLRKIRPY